MGDEGIGVHLVRELTAGYRFTPEVDLVNGGTAGIELLDEAEAQKSLEAWAELEEAERERYGDTLNNPSTDEEFRHDK